MITGTVLRASALAFVIAPAMQAQTSTAGSDTSEWSRRSVVNLSVIQNRPQGAFGRNIGIGYGIDGAYLLRMDDAGVFSLRATAGVVSYGDESRRTPLSEAVGGRVMVDVKTSNYIIPVSLGPQVSWPTGPVRPYANAGIGGLWFLTESKVQGTSDLTPLATTTNHSSFVTSLVLGGGVNVPFSVMTRDVQLDMGVQYVRGGTARYLAPGSIVDLPGGTIAVTPLESTTRMAIVRIGARMGL